MNTRDPFSLRKSSHPSLFASLQSGLQNSATSQRLGNSGTAPPPQEEHGTSLAAGSMSYPVARHGHTSSTDQQQQSPSWQPRKQHHETHMGAFEEKFNDLFGAKDGLPMYKDKPFSYATSRRRVPFYRRQRLLLLLIAVAALFLYWTGFFSRFSSTSSSSGSKTRGRISPKMWELRRYVVKNAFKESWEAYERHAWGFDEYHPIAKSGVQMVPNGMGWIIVDALDTMMLMNLTTELTHAREWMSKSLDYDQDHDVNTFETTIRMLGGLLSAHYLSTEFPHMAPIANVDETGGEDLYIELASGLADRLLGAFQSKSGVPFASINLKTGLGIRSHDMMGASSTAEAATLQLEFKYLANQTGVNEYWDHVEKVMKVIDDNGVRDGLVPIYINADEGTFYGNNIRLGSRGDSYYEYLIKQYLQTSKQEPVYLELWEQALAGVQKHLITYTEKANLTVLAERPNGLDDDLFPKMDHLVCFMPGTIALAATGGCTVAEAKKKGAWGAKQAAELELATQLMKTCWGMYAVTKTGLSPEIAHFHVAKPAPLMAQGIRSSPKTLSDDPKAPWRQDFDIHPADFHNLQRPETVESLFYMWRITGDEMYREWGWTMFEAFMKHTRVAYDLNDGGGAGYTSLGHVDTVPAPQRDNMESFWLAETLKYFYLLFGPDDVLPLDEIVFNTEAHPLPRFKMGKQFKTGWTRKPRDKDGNIIGGSAPPSQPPPSSQQHQPPPPPSKQQQPHEKQQPVLESGADAIKAKGDNHLNAPPVVGAGVDGIKAMDDGHLKAPPAPRDTHAVKDDHAPAHPQDHPPPPPSA